jgi:hypothetical protein
MAPRPLPTLPPLPLSSIVPPHSFSLKLERCLSWSTSENLHSEPEKFEEVAKVLRGGVPKESIDELKIKTNESYGQYVAKEDHECESSEIAKSTQTSSHTWTTWELHQCRNSVDKLTVSRSKPLPPLPSWLQDSTNALAYQCDVIKANSIKTKPTSARLQELRKLMAEEALDY